VKLSKEVKVGLLAVTAIVILYVGFSFLKGIDFFNPSNTYYVLYDNVDGLTESNPVKVNGYRIGRVNAISLLQDGEETRMLVALDITNDLLVYENSVALLEDDGLLGGKSITLNIRNSGRLLNDEDTLRGEVDIALTQMIKDKADPIIAEVDTTLARVNNILGDLSGSGGKVESAIGDLQETATMLRYIVIENRRDINAITTNVKGLTDALNDQQNGIKPLLTELNQFADSLNSMELKETVANANQAIANLQQITQQLQAGQGSLGKLLQDDSLYTNLNKSSADLDRLLIDLRENPGRYLDLRFSIIGGGK
jgi:phospholipid/cholesterol/gamma-HCH transport system substrate-binding protein